MKIDPADIPEMYRAMRKVARSLVRPEDVDDVVQDAFMYSLARKDECKFSPIGALVHTTRWRGLTHREGYAFTCELTEGLIPPRPPNQEDHVALVEAIERIKQTPWGQTLLKFETEEARGLSFDASSREAVVGELRRDYAP